MRLSLGVCLFLVWCTLAEALPDWEQVYPDPVYDASGEHLYRIGSRRVEYENHSLGEGQFFEQYLVSYRETNYLLTLRPEYHSSRWDAYWSLGSELVSIELGVPFQSTAIASFKGRWILGGPNGEIAIHKQSFPDTSNIASYWEKTNYGEGAWTLSSLGSTKQVQAITVMDNRILALCGGELFVSTNGGMDWQATTVPFGINDIESHDGVFFALQVEGSDIQVFRSSDGFGWSLSWSISHGYSGTISSDLMVIDEDLNGYRRPMGTGTRLYVHVDSPEELDGNLISLALSTKSGETWHDHGSYQSIRDPQTGELRMEHWNPLGLPLSSCNLPVPPHAYEAATVNMRVNAEGIQRYSDARWTTIKPMSDTLGMIPETLNQWGVLTFVTQRGWEYSFITIDQDGQAARRHLTDNLPDSAFHWQQVALNGKFYGTYTDDATWIVETEDFKEMSLFLVPEDGVVRRLFRKNDNLAAWYEFQSTDRIHGALSEWDGTWSTPIPVQSGTLDVAYHEGTRRWYTLEYIDEDNRQYSWAEEYHVYSLDGSGQKVREAVIYPQWGQSMRYLDSPDQENILVYGHNEMAVVQPDGTVVYPSFEDTVFSSDSVVSENYYLIGSLISEITYINGWYYLMIYPTPLRTRDFQIFELVQVAGDEVILAVAGFNGDLYAFTNHAVYRRPLKTGYLGSIQHPRGWHHADWLGWFQIIDQELGDIQHLSLGSCWVKETSPHECWIRSSTLGWIYMNRNWSPWAYRLDDGHWYWLDLVGWPPRAWDDAEGVWRELQP